MFGNVARFDDPQSRRVAERSSSRMLKKELLLAKMEAIDSDQTPSNSSNSSRSSDDSNSDDHLESDSDEDSVKKLEKKVRRKKRIAMQRRQKRLKREEELREKEERLNALEKDQNRFHATSGDSYRASGAGVAGGGLAGLNSNSNPAAIDHVAEILRALKGKGSSGQNFAAVVPSPGGLPQSSSSSTTAPAPASQAKKIELRNKFKSAVRKSRGITNMNKMASEAVVKKERRTGINLSGNLHALAEVGNLVNNMNTKLKRVEERNKMSGLAKFLSDDLSKVRHDDFDSGVNAMALLCALVLSVPYQVAGTLDYGNLDWMKGQIAECEGTWTYGFVYTGYRATFIMTVYFSISGMIVATFFFLFKRNNDFDYKIWRSKARYMVMLLFFCTAFSIIALILLTNLYFDYYLLSTSDNICDNNTLPYVVGGNVLALFSFVVAFYLIL